MSSFTDRKVFVAGFFKIDGMKITNVGCSILFLAVFIFRSPGAAQDTLVKINSSRVLTTIIEITPKVIKYKRFDTPSGPLYIIDRREVSRIIYSNGSIDTFSLKTVRPDSLKPWIYKDSKLAKEYNKNFVSLIVSDIFFGKISLGYERIFNPKWSYKIPFSFGLRFLGMKDSVGQNSGHEWDPTWEGVGYYGKYKTFSTGVELYYYTGGQGTLRYFLGPAIEYRQFYYWLHHSTGSYPFYAGYYKKDRGSFYSVLFKNGLIYQPSKKFNVSIHFGVGLYSAKTKYDDKNFSPMQNVDGDGAYEMGVNVGYKF